MSGGSDKGKKEAERHSTRKGAGTIDKLTYTRLGTNKGTRIALGGTAIYISSDEEYEDVADPTMAVIPSSTPIGVPFDSATGFWKRFKWADEEDVDAPTTVVAAGGSAVAPTTTPVTSPSAENIFSASPMPPLGRCVACDFPITVVATGGGLRIPGVADSVGGSANSYRVCDGRYWEVATQTDQSVFPFVG
jgi:hypothetical protein